MTSPLTPVEHLCSRTTFLGQRSEQHSGNPCANRPTSRGKPIPSRIPLPIPTVWRRLSDGEQQHGSICAANLGQEKKPNDHAFMGTEALTIDAWNPMTGGLSFEGKFKFSGEGNGTSGLTQGGMIIGFFTYEKNAPRDGLSHRDRLRGLYQQPQKPQSEPDLDQCLQWLA